VNMLSSLLVVHSEIGNLLASVEQNKFFSYYDYYDRIRCVKWTSPLTHTHSCKLYVSLWRLVSEIDTSRLYSYIAFPALLLAWAKNHVVSQLFTLVSPTSYK
jgi:hypothetical protein